MAPDEAGCSRDKRVLASHDTNRTERSLPPGHHSRCGPSRQRATYNGRNPFPPLSPHRLTAVEGDSGHTRVGLEAAVGAGGVAVRDMLDAIAYVGRDAIGQEVRGAHAAEDQERERRVDFTHAKGGAAGSAGEFHVRNEPT